jgi:putative flippase GtrA
MDITISSDKPFFVRLRNKFLRYGLVGGGTFLLDMLIIVILVSTHLTSGTVAIVIGFLIGVQINYFISHRWVFAGTKRRKVYSYPIFMSLAFIAALSISFFVTLIVNNTPADFYTARIFVAICLGSINFLVNTFFNFKIV